MADVFISYSSKDRERAHVLANALLGLGLSVWWDREIITGQTFDEIIERELELAKSVVVLWSLASVDSEWVKSEAAAAAERGILLPVILDSTRPPLEFRRKQTADLRDWSGDTEHDGFRALYRAVNSILNGAKSQLRPTRARTASTQTRRVIFASVLVAAVLILSAVLMTLPGRNESSEQVRTSNQSSSSVPSEQGAPIGALGDLADAVVGKYFGEVTADSGGSSRSNVVVVVSRLARNTVRVSSEYGRVGTIDIELTRTEQQVFNATGETAFIVDLASRPATLSLSPRGELAYVGKLEK